MGERLRCLKCDTVIEGDGKGSMIYCKCGSIYIDQTPYYYRIGGEPDQIMYINPDDSEILLSELNNTPEMDKKSENEAITRESNDDKKEDKEKDVKVNERIVCEIKMLGDQLGLTKTEIKEKCPAKLAYKNMCMDSNECPYCKHSRKVEYTDDLKIKEVN